MSAITPISSISSISDLLKTQQTSATDTSNELPFQSLFEDAINNVVDTQATVDEEALKLATGQTDDVHNLSIASTQASLSLDLLVQLRNKSLDAYNELMRMNI